MLYRRGDFNHGGRAAQAMITFRQLEALKSVLDAGSVVKAAEMMRLSQPAVSRLLSDLESAVGYRLFERRKGRLSPRGEAWELHAEVDRSLIGLDRIVEAAERIGRRKSTHLRLVALPAFTTGPITGVLRDFLDDHPDVHISLESRTRPQILKDLAAGLHDIGLASMPIEGTDVGVRPLVDTECVCLVPAGHELSGRDTIGPRDLDGVPCIFGIDRTPLRQRLMRVFSNDGVRPDIRVEVTTVHAASALVAQGVGIFIGARLSFDYAHGKDLHVIRFRPTVSATLAVVYPLNRPPDGIAAEFIDAFAKAANAWPSNSG